MDELEKLKHLIEHWLEHNQEHVKTYQEWAERADAIKRDDLSAILRQIAAETEKIDGLFKKARDRAGWS